MFKRGVSGLYSHFCICNSILQYVIGTGQGSHCNDMEAMSASARMRCDVRMLCDVRETIWNAVAYK